MFLSNVFTFFTFYLFLLFYLLYFIFIFTNHNLKSRIEGSLLFPNIFKDLIVSFSFLAQNHVVFYSMIDLGSFFWWINYFIYISVYYIFNLLKDFHFINLVKHFLICKAEQKASQNVLSRRYKFIQTRFQLILVSINFISLLFVL